MSFQAYLDNIQTKTGKRPEDFKTLARKKGLLEPGVKTGEIISWLRSDFGLGHGHSMAIVVTLRSDGRPKLNLNERISNHFTGRKSFWRKPYDQLVAKIGKFGPDIAVAPADSYISLLRNGKKFGIIQVTADRIDLGIKLKGVKAVGRFESSGKWNSMVTHRVRISAPRELDGEVVKWLKLAYDHA